MRPPAFQSRNRTRSVAINVLTDFETIVIVKRMKGLVCGFASVGNWNMKISVSNFGFIWCQIFVSLHFLRSNYHLKKIQIWSWRFERQNTLNDNSRQRLTCLCQRELWKKKLFVYERVWYVYPNALTTVVTSRLGFKANARHVQHCEED